MACGPRNLPVSFSGASLTHFGGLVLLHQFVQQLGLRSRLAQAVRFPQRNNRYSTTEAILALVYPIILGLGRIADRADRRGGPGVKSGRFRV